jgi:hypothetical protein
LSRRKEEDRNWELCGKEKLGTGKKFNDKKEEGRNREF